MGPRATNASESYDGVCTKLSFVYGFLNMILVYAEVYFADNWSPMMMTISQPGESRIASMPLSCFVTPWVTATLKWVKFKIKKMSLCNKQNLTKGGKFIYYFHYTLLLLINLLIYSYVYVHKVCKYICRKSRRSPGCFLRSLRGSVDERKLLVRRSVIK